MKYKIKNYDNIYHAQASKNYLKAMHDEDVPYIENLINGCEFEIEINPNGTINLIDMLDVYLGGHESYENFDDIFSACERLENSYLYDYFGIEI